MYVRVVQLEHIDSSIQSQRIIFYFCVVPIAKIMIFRRKSSQAPISVCDE